MKRTVEIKYPESATLFQFCRRVLDHKFGGVRVIDQDVGQILGFDPADCSHWKKGKKNVRSVHALKKISDHLGVDERLVMDVAIGDVDDLEAYWEFAGYSGFRVNDALIDTARKDFMRSYASGWTKDIDQEFKASTTINEPAIDIAVQGIHEKISFQETPLYLPELAHAYPTLRIIAEEDDQRFQSPNAPVSTYQSEGIYAVSFAKNFENKPYVRFLIAKALADFFLGEPIVTNPRIGMELSHHLNDVRSNLFAAKLLIPAPMLRNEIKKTDIAKDIVSQLADQFWVSKGLMNCRLQYVMTNDCVI